VSTRTAPAATARLQSRLRQLCPGFVPAGAAICTETSTLIPGRVGATAALAKQPIDPRPFWQARARHEIAAYSVLAAAGRPPVPLPRLIAADPGHPLLIMTSIPGTPLGPDRYPAPGFPSAYLDQLLATLDALHHWHVPALRRIPPDTDYAAQYAALPEDLFSPGERARLAATASELTQTLGTQLEHGDAHPANTVASPRAPLALIDLEFLAPRLPGYDLAMLWNVVGTVPALRCRIVARAGPAPQMLTAFWLNTILVLGREILSHQRNAPTPPHHARLARQLRDLAQTRRHLGNTAGQQT